ncbi:hypothetical protein MAPG_09840 [Magnaporthiopsis poae ATCC 64411]|uniref:Glucose-methanol-choline oxidoreductase N-terminal domain-containing protein n=1 Tax=Magnaporthiopsis poae (strain ATCC 64411 / 73-15) TaxID=644358 RepID=A0A0C4EB00_MAGP6|nr:hypothetical protein MAPG_09840 [Magnaporthiopsis poae ATCC 64411]
MFFPAVFFPLLAALAAATPLRDPDAHLHQEERRQLDGLAGEEGVDAVFDYVIVGGGTAGLTLANRLSANGSLTVAVVEGGTFYQTANALLGQTPAGDVMFVASNPNDTKRPVDWNIVTEPQEGLGGRRLFYARGKCLGGSSARNFMIYQRGTKQSYQKWADAVGDQSYSWDRLLPYFQRSVQFHPPGCVALAAYRRVRAAFATVAMRPILAGDVESYPGLGVKTDEQLLGAIRDSAMTLWHASCTCRMGRVDDPNAVVDSAARVIGVKGLRVVDASSFALLPPGHPQSTIYALAEKIADHILTDGTGTGR